MKRVLVLGGGFGGAFAALRIAKAAGRGEAEVTLVSRENYLFFTPFCTEIVGGVMEVRHATAPIREMLRGRARFLEAEVRSIDLAAKKVETSHGSLDWDMLVIALGSVTGTFNLPGVAENAWFMRTLPEAISLRNRIMDCLEAVSRMPPGEDRAARGTIAVAGAGPSGTELACDVRDFLDSVLHTQYRDVSPADITVSVYEGGAKPLPSMDDRLRDFAEKRMRRKGIQLHLNTRIASYDGREITLADGTKRRADTLAWTAGLAPNPVVAALDAPKDKGGRLEVDEFLRLKGREDAWALGDCASFIQDGKPLGPEGQVAMQEATAVARNVAAALRGRPPRRFVFRRMGRLTSLGRRYAVSEFFGMRFKGFFAWWLWRSAYLFKLPGWRNRLRVMMDWTLDLFFPREAVRVRYQQEPQGGRRHGSS